MSVPPLFERLGGDEAVSVAVDQFYDLLLKDSSPVKEFFKSTNMERQRKHQKNFLTTAFGGPKRYSGSTLRAVHKNMNISDFQFDFVGKTLREVLEGLGVKKEEVEEVMAIVESVRNEILDR